MKVFAQMSAVAYGESPRPRASGRTTRREWLAGVRALQQHVTTPVVVMHQAPTSWQTAVPSCLQAVH